MIPKRRTWVIPGMLFLVVLLPVMLAGCTSFGSSGADFQDCNMPDTHCPNLNN